MKTLQKIDAVARDLSEEIHDANFIGAKMKSERRQATLFRDYEDPNKLRETAGRIKQHTLEHLDQYLEQAEASFTRNGAKVHFAVDGESANATVLRIMQENGAKRMVKSKSMVTEEIHLLDYLEKNGMEVVETDLGEFILQIDGDHPSHIVTPIVHKNRRGIAKSFEREGLGEYNDDPETITRRARKYLRQKYLDADVGLTGANFVSAESGRIAIVTNEGNARFCMAANKIHIAVVGIEKLVPSDRDLGLFLNLIGRSGTGQQLTVYNQFIGGPRREGQPHGPEQMHIIFVDNRRTEVLASECREILRCIRCGACLNVCPIYRQSGGHAYRSVYPGPVGAVLSPLLAGNRFPELADLPKASSLCGACNEVCPVNIPIPDLLLRLRDKAKREHVSEAMKGTPKLGMWATLCSQPTMWKTALSMGHTMNYIPTEMIPHPSAKAWQASRKLPKFQGGEFRKWFKGRNKN
ncbi:LutB/LldF family L-lactate oxidation iron-sulfur protein [Coraliomargarita parva]|uniref:LutB/LldF family L-lactate oxidation iron-sulfur protein n=1 Tax=Coraliomargarita parva TaxID=3014050 RepID=UPI0022B3C0FE|nr:LutB/LldF family L-lactate oxidation iron-sulfur protein [Coraliomargarita parva]